VTNSLSSLARDAVAALAVRLRPYLRLTPVLEVEGADLGRPGVSLFLKLEHLQHAGSFKARGAFANLLLREVPPAGVVAASGGNHGVAVAHAARRLGVRARIFVPTVASPAKVARIRADGAELVIGGDRYADALAASEAWAERSGAMPIHAFDQAETLLGQATLARELAAQVPDLDAVVVAVGGGGLIGGIAGWFAGQPHVVGVEPEKAPTLTAALAAGHPVDAEAGGIAADSLAPRRVGTLTFPIAQAHVERVLLVTDEEIRAAQRALWDRLRLVVEPGGAAALAGVRSAGYHARPGERIAVVVCGANTEAVDFDRPAIA
jgi:threonine dehydratase